MPYELIIRVGIGVGVGLVANMMAEWFLTHDEQMRLPIHTLSSRRVMVRLLRWLITTGAVLFFALTTPSSAGLIIAMLLTVTAITDLECRTLPPDWFVYGAVACGIVAGGIEGGLDGLALAAITQALCFALATLCVLVFRATEPGDIKAMMQFGAACGSISILLLAMFAQSAVCILAILVVWLATKRALRAMPLATLVWSGFILAPWLASALTRG